MITEKRLFVVVDSAEKSSSGNWLFIVITISIVNHIKTSTYVLHSKIFYEPTGHILKQHNMK